MSDATRPVPLGLTPQRLEEILQRVCAQTGLPEDGARLLKFTNNAVYALDGAPVVVRIAGSQAVAEQADLVVRLTRWLSERGVPVVRPWDQAPQPLQIEGCTITLWHTVPATGARPTGGDLGRILRDIHALEQADMVLPPWEPIAKARSRIAQAEQLTDAEHRWLMDECDRLDQALNDLEYVLEPGLIHGDAFLGNLICGPHGPVLCDFDSVCAGPREWDLTPVAAGALRFDYGDHAHPELAQEYGFDVADWPGFTTLRQVRELQLVTSVLPVLGSQPSLRPQWRHRFESLRHALPVTWQPYQ